MHRQPHYHSSTPATILYHQPVYVPPSVDDHGRAGKPFQVDGFIAVIMVCVVGTYTLNLGLDPVFVPS